MVNVNYRGSSGRGEKYQVAISADWGNKEVVDLQAAIDHVIADRPGRSRTSWASADGATAAS